jgi:hypothetical protein
MVKHRGKHAIFITEICQLNAVSKYSYMLGAGDAALLDGRYMTGVSPYPPLCEGLIKKTKNSIV